MNKQKQYDMLAVVGPTASGKTAVCIELARRLGGEIISADSMAVYKYMNVGTAKPDEAEQRQAVFHLIDAADPSELYNVGIFEEQADHAAEDIISRGKLPIICGGSGLYVQAAVCGLESQVPQASLEVRSLIERIYRRKGLDFACEFLHRLDPDIYAKTDLQNPRRVLRLLEIYKTTGKKPSEVFAVRNCRQKKYKTVSFGLYMPRPLLHRRINERVDRMLADGLENEARFLLERGSVTALQAIGYKEMTEYIYGTCSLEEAAERIKAATRQLAKRQCSWFGRDKSIIWVDMENKSVQNAADEIIRRLDNEIRL